MMYPSKLSPLERYFSDIRQAFGLIEDSIARHRNGLGDLGHDMVTREFAELRKAIPMHQDQLQPASAREHDNDNQQCPAPKMRAIKALQAFSESVALLDDRMSSFAEPDVIQHLMRDISSAIHFMMGNNPLREVSHR